VTIPSRQQQLHLQSPNSSCQFQPWESTTNYFSRTITITLAINLIDALEEQQAERIGNQSQTLPIITDQQQRDWEATTYSCKQITTITSTNITVEAVSLTEQPTERNGFQLQALPTIFPTVQ